MHLDDYTCVMCTNRLEETSFHLFMHGASGGARGAPAAPTAAGLVEPLVLPFQF
jgi:hypothetical protein